MARLPVSLMNLNVSESLSVRWGAAYHVCGLHADLLSLLEELPQKLHQHETVLFWRLTVALREDEVERVRQDVERYLETSEAPELRALYAGTLTDPEACLAEASRAVHARKTPLTLFQYGRALPPARSLEVLHEAVTLAETEGESYAVFRNGSFYARRLLYVGRLKDALYWATWTRTKLGESDITDPNCHALLANTLAYVQLLLGQPNEAAETLEQVQPFVAKASQPVQDLLGTTQADLALCRDDLESAERLLRVCHHSVPRRSKGETAKYLVRVLLEQEQTEEALDIAREAAALTAMEPEVYRAHTPHSRWGWHSALHLRQKVGLYLKAC